MKKRKLFYSFIFIFTFLSSITARNYSVIHDDFVRKGKTMYTCNVNLDENEQKLTVLFNETVGEVSILFLNEDTGEFIYVGYCNAKIGDEHIIYFDHKISNFDTCKITITDGVHFYIGTYE